MRRNAYQALREGAAVVDLTGRGHIRLTGEDRVRLLHAMTTQHIQQMQPGDVAYAFFLNAQGRILADANVLCRESDLLLDTEASTAALVAAHIDKYVIADDVTVEDLTAHTAVMAVEGPAAADMINNLGVDPAPAPGRWVDWRNNVVAALSASGMPGYRIFAPAIERESLFQWIAGSGAVAAGEPELQVVRLENGIARYSVDVTEREIPQETQLMHAVHFNKGCYLGQEIVERVRSRGSVHRRLAQLLVAGDAPVAPKTRILYGGKEAGEVTSAAWSPAADATVVLGYVRAETFRPDAQYEVAGRTATPGGNQPARPR